MMNEINPLIWPSPNGIGIMDPAPVAADRRRVRRRRASSRPRRRPTAYRTDLAEAALAELADADTKGESFVKGTVEVTPGGN